MIFFCSTSRLTSCRLAGLVWLPTLAKPAEKRYRCFYSPKMLLLLSKHVAFTLQICGFYLVLTMSFLYKNTSCKKLSTLTSLDQALHSLSRQFSGSAQNSARMQKTQRSARVGQSTGTRSSSPSRPSASGLARSLWTRHPAPAS